MFLCSILFIKHCITFSQAQVGRLSENLAKLRIKSSFFLKRPGTAERFESNRLIDSVYWILCILLHSKNPLYSAEIISGTWVDVRTTFNAAQNASLRVSLSPLTYPTNQCLTFPLSESLFASDKRLSAKILEDKETRKMWKADDENPVKQWK